ncbi:MAG: deoxyribonuclease V [Candidatus Bathyarchaeota archaeon]|nr:deoxyribonuclease V [Candidatus Bathyarchaeota archaeon]MDH5787265.1 deoxyribonuclease V [Candidatus Bathyarchaeota archaeon]
MDLAGVKSGFSIKKAHEAQSRLARQVIFEDKLPKNIRYVAGVDLAYVKGMSIGAVAVLAYDSLRLIESRTSFCKTQFPYVPTLLSFREIPPAVACTRKLKVQPDVFLVDGQGFAHPYRCGFASHFGLVINRPTIGVAKSRLFGEVKERGNNDNVAFLKNKDEIVGAVITTKRGCKPVYVSVGHMVSLNTAIKIVKHCTLNRRIPEPVLKAHETASTEKRKNQ